MNKAGRSRGQNRTKSAKSVKAVLKTKVLKKFNFSNLAIAVLSIFAGYLVVSFSIMQDHQAQQNPVDRITRSVDRIADSFELYNQKKFLNTAAPVTAPGQ